ncbi:MAG TPA: TadE family protein [Acidimicrobiales bacterium]|nr:TadE family protein [Acidimicrobiales bacterium]
MSDEGGQAARRPSRCADAGAATTETVLIFPVLIMLLFLVVAAGRLTDAKSDVVSAASDAARAASIAGTPGEATAAARDIANETLAGEGVECSGGADVQLAYEPRFERGATVHATVRCDVRTDDLALLNLPGVVTVTQHAYEPIDTHRSL